MPSSAERVPPAPIPFLCPSSRKKCDGRHIDPVTEVTSAFVTRDTPLGGPWGEDATVRVALRGQELEREVNQVAEKKITPKKATKSTAKRSSGEAATRVTKRKARRARKAR
jgi:hypothetical protein